MKTYTPKYSTLEQVAEIEKLANDGHKDALIAFGADCVHEFGKDLARNCLIALGLGALVGLASGVIKGIKEAKEEQKKEENKKYVVLHLVNKTK